MTTNCNIEAPICDGSASTPAKIVPGGVPGIFWALKDEAGARVLKLRPMECLPGVKEDQLSFDGRLPVVRLAYHDIGPIDVNLTAFSPLILGDTSPDYRDSSIPGALFTYELVNNTDREQEYTFLHSWQNMCGCTGFYNEKYWGVNDNRGNQVEFRTEGKYPGAWHFSTNEEAQPRGKGNYSIRVDAPAGTKLETRTYKDHHEMWDQVVQGKPLSVDAPWLFGSNSLLAVSGKISAHGKTSIRVAIGWYFPNLTKEYHPEINFGRMYENWFKDSWEVAEYLLNEGGRLFEATTDWQNKLWASNLPQWLKYKLCDDLFPMITNSWYTKNGDFTISEAVTNMGAMMGTIDQRNASQAPYLLAFPKLCRSELELFRARQVKPGDANEKGMHYDFSTGNCDLMIDQVGAVPHDIGHDDIGSYSITPGAEWIAGHWPDLLSGYVLQWYGYYCWTNDPVAASECYLSCKSTMAFLESIDFNKDGIPELWGAGSSSYDNYSFPYYGVMPYAATMYMAALAAMEKWAVDKGDTQYAAALKARRELANKSLVESNWTGSYFRTWRDESHENWKNSKRPHGLESNSIHVSQMAGQWYAKHDVSGLYC